MLYHEKTDIKQYKRKTANGDKTFNQVNLGYESKFDKGEHIIVVRESDFNDLISKVNLLIEFESKVKDVTDELESVKSENKEYSKQLLELSNQVNILSDKLNTANTELQKEKDLKSSIIMKYEGIMSDVQNKFFFRLLCTMPISYKKLHNDSEIKKIVEVNKKE